MSLLQFYFQRALNTTSDFSLLIACFNNIESIKVV